MMLRALYPPPRLAQVQDIVAGGWKYFVAIFDVEIEDGLGCLADRQPQGDDAPGRSSRDQVKIVAYASAAEVTALDLTQDCRGQYAADAATVD
jgi:hypothetical protein